MRARFDLKAADFLPDPAKKKYYNERHFAAAAARYDVATRAMSLGRDAAWKRALVAALPDIPSPFCVDLACGTGDVSFLLSKKYPRGEIVGVDLTEPMLALARLRNRGPNVRFVRQDMCATGLGAESADVVTGSYALRNAPDLGTALDEVRRILSPGGTAAFLDFARPAGGLLRGAELALLKGWCGFWGLALHGNPEIHGYVAASLGAFPDRASFRKLLLARGLEVTLARSFCLGIVDLIVVRKESAKASHS